MKFGGTPWKDLPEMIKAGYEPEYTRSLADLYWRTLIVSAFVVLVLVFLYSTWVLLRILNDLGGSPDTSVLPAPMLNRTELNATVRAFEERKAQFDALKANPPAVVKDPSI
ncbi:hypothetical protein HY971_02505 [Candidatus Kaiserbacteria bacterium]|nr:hypothetical protein [Candidatus Kaiserbacteria bacterium]